MDLLGRLKQLLGGEEPQRQPIVNKQAARPRMARPAIPDVRQPMPYAQKRPMMGAQQAMGGLDEYQIDQATGGRFQGGLRDMQSPRQINPMGFTGGSGFSPEYNQEGYSNLQGGAPNFSSYGVQYPQGEFRNRLRVR